MESKSPFNACRNFLRSSCVLSFLDIACDSLYQNFAPKCAAPYLNDLAVCTLSSRVLADGSFKSLLNKFSDCSVLTNSEVDFELRRFKMFSAKDSLKFLEDLSSPPSSGGTRPRSCLTSSESSLVGLANLGGSSGALIQPRVK